jgi:hypothetical protein
MTTTILPSLVDAGIVITLKPCSKESKGHVTIPHPINIMLPNGDIKLGYWHLTYDTHKETRYKAMVKEN